MHKGDKPPGISRFLKILGNGVDGEFSNKAPRRANLIYLWNYHLILTPLALFNLRFLSLIVDELITGNEARLPGLDSLRLEKQEDYFAQLPETRTLSKRGMDTAEID